MGMDKARFSGLEGVMEKTPHTLVSFLKIDFSERKGERVKHQRERETSIACLLRAP